MQLLVDALLMSYVVCIIYKKVYILLLSCALSIAAHEAVNATSCIHELALSGIERVRGA